MAHNHLIRYTSWDESCIITELNNQEERDLIDLCYRENIQFDSSLPATSKRLLLNILDETDGIEVVSISKNSVFIDLSTDEEDDDIEIIEHACPNERQVILSQNTNISNPKSINGLRAIIIDGSNIAFSHGFGNFEPKGIEIAVKYFVDRGHDHIYVLVSRHYQLEGGKIFERLEKAKILIYTPSRIVNKIRETSYEDKLILEAALGHDGVVISNDQFRDLLHIKKYKNIIINRLIPYTFVGDLFMLPDDPKGVFGPHLSTMLSTASSLAESSSVKRRKPVNIKKLRKPFSVRNLIRKHPRKSKFLKKVK